MPLLIGLAVAILVYTVVGALFEYLWGVPARSGALTREMERLNAGQIRFGVRWLATLWGFFQPSGSEGYPFARTLIALALGGFLLGVLVFGSVLFGLALSLIAVPYRFYLLSTLRRKRRDLLTIQFRDAMVSISASLRAGTSLRTAIERSLQDLRRVLYDQKQTPIIAEIEQMVREMQLGCSVEEALIRFRNRASLEDVSNFVNAALLCKVRGGNLPVVMASIAQIIGDKLAVKNQVQVLTAGKRMEASALTVMPGVLVVALSVLTPDYLSPLFTTLLGQLLALLAVIMLVAAFFIGRKITDIEV